MQTDLDKKIDLLTLIDAALNEVRPHLAADGGNVEVVDITDDNVVQLRLLGSCSNCSMSYMTMKAGLEQAIKSKLPFVSGVEAVASL